MKSLLVYMRGYRKEAILSPLFKLLEAVLELQVPLLMAAMIDNGIANQDISYVLQMGAALLGLGLVGLGVSLTAQYYAAKAAVGFSTKLKHTLFAHVMRFSYSQMDAFGSSMLINRLTTDAQQVQTGVNMTLRLLLRSPFIVVGAMLMAFAVDAQVALVFALLIALLAVVVFILMALTLPRYREVQGKLDGLLLRTRETLTGVRVIRAFGKEKDEVQRFDGENQEVFTMQNRVGNLSGLMNPLTFVLVNGGLVALLWSGALRVQAGVLSQGAVVALVNYLLQISVELIKLANLLVTITRALACAKRIEAVLAVKPDMDAERLPAATSPAAEATEAAVRFEHVSMRYNGASEASLTDISFTALRGQTIGVIGGTGSGKSTLINLIPRFYDATEGVVLVHGMDVKQQNPKALRELSAIVPQKAELFSGSIRDNLRWGKENATEDELWRALETAQAAEIVRGKAYGLDENLEQNGRNLSGGQRQRLTIARALVKDAPILILDDSSSALDFATDAALRKALREMSGDRTIFIASQRASSVRGADSILVLEDGKLVGLGTHDELMRDSVVYQEIYYSQYPKEA